MEKTNGKETGMEKRGTGEMIRILQKDGEKIQHIGRGLIECRKRWDARRGVWIAVVMEFVGGKWEGFVTIKTGKEIS